MPITNVKQIRRFTQTCGARARVVPACVPAWRDDVVPARPGERPRSSPSDEDEARPRPRHRYPWAEPMRRVFDIDVLRRQVGRARRRLVALITSRQVIERILAHLGLPTEPPTISPPRAPPELELVF